MAGPEKGRRCNGPGREMGASARLGYRGRRKEIGRDMGLWLGIGGVIGNGGGRSSGVLIRKNHFFSKRRACAPEKVGSLVNKGVLL